MDIILAVIHVTIVQISCFFAEPTMLMLFWHSLFWFWTCLYIHIFKTFHLIKLWKQCTCDMHKTIIRRFFKCTNLLMTYSTILLGKILFTKSKYSSSYMCDFRTRMITSITNKHLYFIPFASDHIIIRCFYAIAIMMHSHSTAITDQHLHAFLFMKKSSK